MKQAKVMVEIPASLKNEINKFLVEKADGNSIQGTLKIIVVRSLYDYLIKSGCKVDKSTKKDCMEIISKARFQI